MMMRDCACCHPGDAWLLHIADISLEQSVRGKRIHVRAIFTRASECWGGDFNFLVDNLPNSLDKTSSIISAIASLASDEEYLSPITETDEVDYTYGAWNKVKRISTELEKQ